MKQSFFIFGFGLAVIFFLSNLFFVNTALAQEGLQPYFRPPNLPQLKDAETADAEQQTRFLIGDIITVFLSIAGIIAVWAIVNNSFWIVVSIGKGEIIDQRKKALFWAVSALILIMLSYAIIRFLTKFVVDVAEISEPSGSSPTQSTERAGP